MAAAIVRYVSLLALLSAPTASFALTGDPAASVVTGAAHDSLLTSQAHYWHWRRHHYWRGPILPPDYERRCGWEQRLQPFPTRYGYAYACVPWR
jgi:hypothetical protein